MYVVAKYVAMPANCYVHCYDPAGLWFFPILCFFLTFEMMILKYYGEILKKKKSEFSLTETFRLSENMCKYC